MSAWQIISIIAGSILLYVIIVVNRLISLRTRVDNAWSDIDVQLKRRWDLVPRLVETVRGYAVHEAQTLEDAIQARGQAQSSAGPAQRGQTELQLDAHVGKLIALAEAYPTLKADELFRTLQTNLVEIENNIQSARRYYNAVVRDFNTMRQQFPTSIIAAIGRFQPRQFFQLGSQAEAAVPTVRMEKT